MGGACACESMPALWRARLARWSSPCSWLAHTPPNSAFAVFGCGFYYGANAVGKRVKKRYTRFNVSLTLSRSGTGSAAGVRGAATALYLRQPPATPDADLVWTTEATTTNKSDSENLTFVAWDLTFVGLFGPCPCPWSHVTCHRKFMSPTPMHHVPHDPNSPTSTCTHARRHVHVHVPRHADGDARSPCPRGAPLPQSTLIILS